MGEKKNGSDIPLQPRAQEIPADAPCCANCGHSVSAQLPPPNIGRVRVCKLLPPTPIAIRDKNGNIVSMIAVSPAVQDTDFCAHVQLREATSDDGSQVADTLAASMTKTE